MKSFRFSYILAMLLAGGATTALTGCIDTTEPAGITELRGAKALLLKAKAAYVDAKTQRQNVYMEQDKVKLEQDKIDLEISKLNLELQKALNDLKLDSTNAAKQLVLEKIQKERDELAQQAEASWWTLQQNITTAETNYKKAVVDLQVALLTYKDEAIAGSIEMYTKQLYGIAWKDVANTNPGDVLTGGLYGLLNQANLDLLDAQREKVLFTANSENYLASLNLKKTEQEKILNIQNELLTNLKALAEKYSDGNNLQSVQERLIELNQEIEALKQKKIDLYDEAQNMKTTSLAGVSEQLADYNEILAKDTTVTIDIVDEKLQNDLGGSSIGRLYSDAFENNDGKYEMVAPIEISDVLRDLSNGSDLTNILNNIKSIYQSQYSDAYSVYTDKSLSGSELFESDGKTVKAAYNAQIQNEKERLALDQAKVRAEYETALKTWLDAYKEFTDDLNAYKGYKDEPTIYADAQKLISDYKEAISDLDSNDPDDQTEYLTLAKALRDNLVKTYFDLREPIDGAGSYYAQFKKDYVEKDKDGKDKLTITNMANFTDDLNYDILGYQTIGNRSYTSYQLEDAKGSLPAFLSAAVDLFGNASGSSIYLKTTLQPVKTDKGYELPGDLDVTSYDYSYLNTNEYNMTSGSKFVKAALTYNDPAILSTLPTWVKLYETIEAQDKQLDERVEGIVEAKNALVEANKDAFKAIWEKEIECYLVDAEITLDKDGDGYVDVTNVFSNDNPYYVYYIENVGQSDKDNTDFTFVAPAATSELATLEAEKALLENWANNETFTYVYYDETDGTYKTGTKADTWDNLVAAQESVVETAQEGLDNIQKRIDLLNEIGWIDGNDATSNITSITESEGTKYVELLDKEIEQAQKKVDVLQAEFDKVQAKIQSLIEAVEKEDFGSSDATYPGFEVDNSTSTNTPSTDTPSTDTPSGDATNQEQPATEEPA